MGHRHFDHPKSEKLAEGQGPEYKDYFQFKEPIRHIPPHRVLAINRGEKENALSVKLEWDAETGRRVALERLPLPLPGEAPTQAAAAAAAARRLPKPYAEAARRRAMPPAAETPQPPVADAPRPPTHARIGARRATRRPRRTVTSAPCGPREPRRLQKHPHRRFLERRRTTL